MKSLNDFILSFLEAIKTNNLEKMNNELASSVSLIVQSFQGGLVSDVVQLEGVESVTNFFRVKFPDLKGYELRIQKIEGPRAVLEWGAKELSCFSQPTNYTLLIEISKQGISRLFLMNDT